MVVDVKRWSHPQDFVALVAGVYAALSPIWTTTTTAATWTVVVLGVVTAALAVLSLARPGVIADGLMAVMGVLFVLSPWVVGFAGTHPKAWRAWSGGAGVFGGGAADVVEARLSHHGGGLAASH